MGLRVITTVTTIVLARLLDPGDFGMVALAQIALSTAGVLAGLGMGPAVIQSQADRSQVAYHALVITAISGLLTMGGVLAFADPLARILGNANLVPILLWMSFLLPFTALTIVPEALLQKELHFGRISAVVIAGELLYAMLAIVLALLGFGVWSLVYATLGKSLLALGMIWALLPKESRPRRRPWEWVSIGKGLLGYGLRTTGSGLTTFVYQMVDNFVVGNRLGTTALGYYGKAMDFTSRTVDGFSNVIGSVLFPSFASIQSEKERLSRAYLRTLRVTSFITVPLAAGIFVTAADMVETLLGEKWMPMIPALQILAFVSLVKPLSASTSALFFAVGKPEMNMRAGLVVLGVMIAFIAALLPMGFSGVALAVLMAHIAGFFFNVYQVHRVLRGTGHLMFSAIAPALVASAAMILVVQLTRIALVAASGAVGIAGLAALVMVGSLAYAGILYTVQRPLLLEVYGMIRGRFTAA
jgi:O-antigen/teichoic acid export membrane protein